MNVLLSVGAYLFFLYIILLILNEDMNKLVKDILLLLGGVGSVIIAISAFLTIYYTYTPEMTWVAQPIPGGLNSCNIAVYDNACPATLINGTAAGFYLKNTGGVKAKISLFLSSPNAKFSYNDNSWQEVPNQTSTFAFIPYFSNVYRISIRANATCSGEILGFCRSSYQPVICNYTTSKLPNNTITASLITT